MNLKQEKDATTNAHPFLYPVNVLGHIDYHSRLGWCKHITFYNTKQQKNAIHR